MFSGTTYRHKNGRRLGQAGLANAIAQDVTGMMLAQAFVTIRRMGCRLVINRLDGVPHRTTPLSKNVQVIYVDVVGGSVRKSWPRLHT